LDAAELARTSSEGLCAISKSLTGRKSGVPISEDVIFAISPGAFADKRDRISTDLTYVRAVCGFDVQWVVLGNNPIHNAVTERMSSRLLCLLDPLKARSGYKASRFCYLFCRQCWVPRVIVAISTERTSMAISSLCVLAVASVELV
jgi:hypothetical protein